MGAGQSKPTTFVLRNASVTSLDIPIQDTRLHSSAEPGYSSDDLDAIVQDRVGRELQAHQQRRLIHEQRSADQVRREAEDLIRRQRNAPAPTPKEEFLKAQQEVVLCYKNNPGRALDCWKEEFVLTVQ
nr:hypothetical protein HK105_005560 [Polyrhizophydium stewartii]